MGAAAVGSAKPTVGAVETFASGFYQKMWDYVDEHYSEEKKHIDLWPLNGESILPVLPGLWWPNRIRIVNHLNYLFKLNYIKFK